MEAQTDLDFFDLYHLREAWLTVQRKGAQGGIDGVSIQEFAANADEALRRLSEELGNNCYTPEPYDRVYVPQPGKAPRPLGLPTVRDKIVQMAVRNAIEPIFNPIFLDCSYAYRPGKGHRKAIRRTEHYLRQGRVWVTTCDIDRFFDSLDHDLLLSFVQEKVADPRILRLIQLWLKIGVVHGDQYRDTDKGVPQGGVISPLLSNIYLHKFDVEIVGKGWKLVRYADDFIILDRNREKTGQAHDQAEEFLRTRLKLRLNPSKEKTWHVKSGFVFLGIQFRGYQRTMAPEKVKKAELKIDHICTRGRSRSLHDTVEEINDSIKSWRYYYGDTDVQSQFTHLENVLRQRLAALVAGKISAGQLRSVREAESALQRLEFLLQKSRRDRRRFIQGILGGQGPPQRKPTGSGAPQPEKRRLSRSRRPRHRRREQRRRHDASSPTAIKQAVSRKKKKYQRRYASAAELVVSRRGYSIGKMYERVVVREKGIVVRQTSRHRLRHILVLARGVSLSSDVIYLCGENGIPLDFIDFRGRPVARLSSPAQPILDVGLAQLRAFTNGKAQYLARALVEAKVRNQLNLMKYFHKYRKDADAEFSCCFEEEETRILGYLKELEGFEGDWSVDQRRGELLAIEGRAASSYWRLVKLLVRQRVEFPGRVRQGATDLFNSLLNYGYAILYSRVWGAVLRAGLNPMISFLHADRPGEPTLVFDLVEEFRPQAVDRVVITLFTRREKLRLKGDRLDWRTRRKLAANVVERLNTPFRHRGRECTLAQIINLQARDLARYLEGKRQVYRPFIAAW